MNQAMTLDGRLIDAKYAASQKDYLCPCCNQKVYKSSNIDTYYFKHRIPVIYPDCLLYTVNGQHEEEWKNLYKSLYKVLEEDDFLFLDDELKELPKHFMTQSLKKYSANFLNKVLEKWNRIDYRIIENIIDALDFNDEFSEDKIVEIIDNYSIKKNQNFHSKRILSKVVHKTVDNTEKHYAYFKKIIEETKEENWKEYSNVLSEDHSPLISLEMIDEYQSNKKFDNSINKRINYLLKRIREINYSSLEDQLIHQMILLKKGFDYIKYVSETILHGSKNEKIAVYRKCIINHTNDKEIIRIAKILLSEQSDIKKEWSKNLKKFENIVKSDNIEEFRQYSLEQIDKIQIEGHQLIRKLIEYDSSAILRSLLKSKFVNKIHLNGFERDNKNPLIFSIISKRWNISVLLILGGAKTSAMYNNFSLIEILNYDESKEAKELIGFIEDFDLEKEDCNNSNLIENHLNKLLLYYSIFELFSCLSSNNQVKYFKLMEENGLSFNEFVPYCVENDIDFSNWQLFSDEEIKKYLSNSDILNKSIIFKIYHNGFPLVTLCKYLTPDELITIGIPRDDIILSRIFSYRTLLENGFSIRILKKYGYRS